VGDTPEYRQEVLFYVSFKQTNSQTTWKCMENANICNN